MQSTPGQFPASMIPTNDMWSPITEEARAAYFKLLKPKEIECYQKLIKHDPEWAKYNPKFTMKFLFARKMDVERAVTLLRNHLVWRKKWDIDNIDLATVKAYLDMSFFAFDPTARDKDGRGVAYLFPAHFNASLLADTKRYIHFTWWFGLISSDVHIDNDREGYAYIEDFKDASFSDLAGMGGDKTMKEMFDGVQNAVPARLRRIYLLNAPWYVRFLLAMVKPFMSSKLQSKVKSVTVEELAAEFPGGTNALLPAVGGRSTFNYRNWVAQLCGQTPK